MRWEVGVGRSSGAKRVDSVVRVFSTDLLEVTTCETRATCSCGGICQSSTMSVSMLGSAASALALRVSIATRQRFAHVWLIEETRVARGPGPPTGETLTIARRSALDTTSLLNDSCLDGSVGS